MINGEIVKVRLYRLKGELQEFFDILVENKCPDATLVAYVSVSLLYFKDLYSRSFPKSE